MTNSQTRKEISVIKSALKHGLSSEYIERMWYDERCEGFDMRRLPPHESNVIAIRFVAQPDGTLEMIAEERADCYQVFHAQIAPEGKTTTLLAEALELYGFPAK